MPGAKVLDHWGLGQGLDSRILPMDPASFPSLLEVAGLVFAPWRALRSCWADVCTLAGFDASSGRATLKSTPIAVLLRAQHPSLQLRALLP